MRWPAAQTRLLCSPSADDGKPLPSMLRHLTSKIKATGPITVAEYMREVLTNPVTVSNDRTPWKFKCWLINLLHSYFLFYKRKIIFSLSLMRLAHWGRQRLGSVHGASQFRVISSVTVLPVWPLTALIVKHFVTLLFWKATTQNHYSNHCICLSYRPSDYHIQMRLPASWQNMD